MTAAPSAAPRSPSGCPSRRTVPRLSASSGEGAGPVTPPVQVVDVHPASVVVFVAIAALAASAWAIVTIASDTVTGIAVGVVVGVALSRQTPCDQ